MGNTKEWFYKHINDPYVKLAHKHGYRSRSAIKLLEINKKFNILKEGYKLLDIGAAPGGWSQVCSRKKIKTIGVDLLTIKPIFNCEFIVANIMDNNKYFLSTTFSNKNFNGFISDIAPNATGNQWTDHIKIIEFNNIVVDNCINNTLGRGGFLIMKSFVGEESKILLNRLKKQFESVKYFKPDSSKKTSKEFYIICLNFMQ